MPKSKVRSLRGGSELEKAPNCGSRGSCFKISVQSRHVLCSIHTRISNWELQEGGFCSKNLQEGIRDLSRTKARKETLNLGGLFFLWRWGAVATEDEVGG